MQKLVISALVICLAVAISASAQGILKGVVIRQGALNSNPALMAKFKLEQSYQALASYLDKHGREKLATVQNAWDEYSQAECDFLSTASAAEPLHAQTYEECLTGLRRQRTEDILYQVHWYQILDPTLSHLKPAR